MSVSWFKRDCCRSVIPKGGACPTREADQNHLRKEWWATLITTYSLDELGAERLSKGTGHSVQEQNIWN